jgi:hypothetical protein
MMMILEIYGNEILDHISIVSPSFLRCRSASSVNNVKTCL